MERNGTRAMRVDPGRDIRSAQLTEIPGIVLLHFSFLKLFPALRSTIGFQIGF